MPAVRALTSLWVKLLLAVLAVGAPTWWLAERHDRFAQARMGAVASAIAGREVCVRCPGPFGRAFGYDIVEGSVRFGPDGRPADETQLCEQACGELDALGDGRRAGLLECLERTGGTCGTEGTTLAAAVDVLSHESWHLHGVMNEAVTECRSLQTMGWTAAGSAPARRRAAPSRACSSTSATSCCPTATAAPTATTADPWTCTPTSRSGLKGASMLSRARVPA